MMTDDEVAARAVRLVDLDRRRTRNEAHPAKNYYRSEIQMLSDEIDQVAASPEMLLHPMAHAIFRAASES